MRRYSHLPFIYNLLIEVTESRSMQSSYLNTQIKQQFKLFPSDCSNFDYRSLVHEDNFDKEFSKYMHQELESFLLDATVSETGKHGTSEAHTFKRKLCIRMAIGILCVAMNPSAVFLQTLVGLVCYAYGLSDMGFSILNMLGCTCSIDQIRKHGSYWANNRVTSDELQATESMFWRVSFDNLNFKIKYAKKLTTPGPKKMLNLITAQVCCRNVPTVPNVLLSGGLQYLCTMNLLPFLNDCNSHVTPEMFTVDLLDPVLLYYNESVFKIVKERPDYNTDDNNECESVFVGLRHFSPISLLPSLT